MISPFANAPEAILPIGQTPYLSKVTNREEWLPANIGVVGARSADANLISLLRNMMEVTKVQTVVHTGQISFPSELFSEVNNFVVQSV